MFANNKNCPSHPQLKLTKICLNEDCMEPLCDRCLPSHLTLHNQLLIRPNIRPIEELSRTSLQANQSALVPSPDTYNKHMTSNMIKGYLDDFYKKNKLNQAKKSPQKCNLATSDVKSVLDGMFEDNKTSVGVDFKEKLH